MLLDSTGPLARAAVEAIHTGDVPALQDLLTTHPDLARARLGDTKVARTLLHVATDWPGHYPGGPHTVTTLVTAGADVNARLPARTARPRCTGRPAATTSPSWTFSSTTVGGAPLTVPARPPAVRP